MLYQENGKSQIRNSRRGAPELPFMTFSGSYVWRMAPSSASCNFPDISIWFTKPGTEELDYPFHDLDTNLQTLGKVVASQGASGIVLRGHGRHSCVQDQYDTDYGFTLTWNNNNENEPKIGLKRWQTVHTVRDPKKDQRIETEFTRDAGTATSAKLTPFERNIALFVPFGYCGRGDDTSRFQSDNRASIITPCPPRTRCANHNV